MALDPPRQVRICKIASRYLVFDIDDVVALRRHHTICAVFVGTMPQNPTQNVFMGLPVELLPEEVHVLVAKGAAYVADDTLAHLALLGRPENSAARHEYLQSLRTQRRDAQRSWDEDREARAAGARAKHERKRAAKRSSEAVVDESSEAALFEEPAKPGTPRPGPAHGGAAAQMIPGMTPATSGGLVTRAADHALEDAGAPCPLYAHLNAKGYFITPGLRFGGDYSVYPGDPFRFHAHHLATSYGWDEEISILDLIGNGRLGTAVKKSFLFGAQKPSLDGESGRDTGADGDGVRAFCVEWAAM